MRALVLLLAVAATSSGCATVAARNVLGPRLPYEARVYLLDAEEDLMTTRARADQAERDLYRAKRELADAEKRFDSLKESPLKKEAKAEVAVAEAKVAREERSLDLLDAKTVCADKRYLAARYRAEVKFKLRGADEAEANTLWEKADACEAKLQKRELALADAEEKLARARAEQDRASISASSQAPLEHPRPWVE